jgi:hypothetical protein
VSSIIVTGIGVAAMFGLGWLLNPVGNTVIAADIPLPVNVCRVVGQNLILELVPSPGLMASGDKPVTDQYSSATCHVSTKADAGRQVPRSQLAIVLNRYRGQNAVAHAEANLAYEQRLDHAAAAYHPLTGLGDEGYLTHGAKGGNDPVTATVVARAGKDIVTVRYEAISASQALVDETAVTLAQLILYRAVVSR